jgi:hypothetical protein
MNSAAARFSATFEQTGFVDTTGRRGIFVMPTPRGSAAASSLLPAKKIHKLCKSIRQTSLLLDQAIIVEYASTADFPMSIRANTLL